jgi:putative FmdB family regulatory protein
MPFYEYQCKSCGHHLEAMQKINDAPLKKCPHCGKSQLTRLMSAPVFRLKGGGWYETDFKGDQDNKKNLADRPEAEAATDVKKPESDAKTAEATAKDAAKPADKAADKPAEKAAPTESKKADGHGISKRGAVTAAKPTAARPTPARSHAARPNAARPKPRAAVAKKAAKAKGRR